MNAMNRRHNTKVPALLLLLAAVLLVAVTAGCERKVEGTVSAESPVSDECFTCHNGQQDAQQGEWVNSVHASGENVDYTSRDGDDCVKCHNQDGFIEFIESGTFLGAGNAKAIGCFACHDPHVNGNLDLRTMEATTLEDGSTFDHGKGNLCSNCHHSRYDASAIDSNIVLYRYWGPHHGPQGDIYTAANAYEGFPGWADTTSNPHWSITDACVGCHMQYANTHAGYDVGGHSWNMEDEAGNNLTLVCRNCHSEIGSRGGDYDDVRDGNDYDRDGTPNGFMTEVGGMLDSLGAILLARGLIDGTDHPVDTTVVDPNETGAVYNFLNVHEDRSHGVHNPRYTVQMLNWSWDYMKALP
jgi:hypothetical protein